MEKFIENYKGVIIFYIIVALLSLIFTMKLSNLNSQANNANYNELETEFA